MERIQVAMFKETEYPKSTDLLTNPIKSKHVRLPISIGLTQVYSILV